MSSAPRLLCTRASNSSRGRPWALYTRQEFNLRRTVIMADKVQKLGLERDYKQYLYFINKDGNVARKKKGGDGAEEVVAETKLVREKGYLYFIDKDGDLARAPRKGKSDTASESHPPQGGEHSH
jgi:hypothetical protein